MKLRFPRHPRYHSLVGVFGGEARATANSIFGLGIYLGGALASLGAFVDEQEKSLLQLFTQTRVGFNPTRIGHLLIEHDRERVCTPEFV